MTTIATDGLTIAADGLTVFGNFPSRCPAEKMLVRPEAIYAAAGPAGLLPALADWYAAGADPANPPKLKAEDGWQLLVIQAGRISYFDDHTLYPVEMLPPFALGSGAEFAIGAMTAGASAAAAVAVAMKCDVKTGGEIQVINISEALGLEKKEAAE